MARARWSVSAAFVGVSAVAGSSIITHARRDAVRQSIRRLGSLMGHYGSVVAVSARPSRTAPPAAHPRGARLPIRLSTAFSHVRAAPARVRYERVPLSLVRVRDATAHSLAAVRQSDRWTSARRAGSRACYARIPVSVQVRRGNQVRFKCQGRSFNRIGTVRSICQPDWAAQNFCRPQRRAFPFRTWIGTSVVALGRAFSYVPYITTGG